MPTREEVKKVMEKHYDRIMTEPDPPTTWIKYADKKPDVGDLITVKEQRGCNQNYHSGYVTEGTLGHNRRVCGGSSWYELAYYDEYTILEKSTPAKVVKERPRLREGDFLITNNCLCEECVVLYENKEAGLWMVSFDKGSLCSVIEQEVIKHYRNGKLIWSADND